MVNGVDFIHDYMFMKSTRRAVLNSLLSDNGCTLMPWNVCLKMKVF